MPVKPLARCSYIGCKNRVQKGYSQCIEHLRLNYKTYNKYNKKSINPFYYTTEWRRFRKEYLTDNMYCVNCKKMNRLTLAIIVDHIKPLLLGGDPYNLSNLQPLCESCHNSKRSKERRALLNKES